jgi:hypothetical protein
VIVALPRPEVALFAVDDRSAQVTWRRLRPGPLRLRVLDEQRRSLAAVAPIEVLIDGRAEEHLGVDQVAGPIGSLTIEGLPPTRSLVIEITGRAVGDTRSTFTVRTLASLPGEERCRVATISDLHLGSRVFGHRGTIVEDPVPPVPHPLRCSRRRPPRRWRGAPSGSS